MQARAHATISSVVRGTLGFAAFGVAPLIGASMIKGCTRRVLSMLLAQACEEASSRIAVGRLHADLPLVVAHGEASRVADAAVGAGGVEAEGGQAALDLLDLGE